MVIRTMTRNDTHAEPRTELFSLPNGFRALVLEMGHFLQSKGRMADAAELYEHFLNGMQPHVLLPIEMPPAATDLVTPAKKHHYINFPGLEKVLPL